MSVPFFPAGVRALATLPTTEPWLIGLDYDGTLTPIVADPRLAHLDPAMRETLRTLAQCPQTQVAIISGRALTDVQARVAVPELTYAGNHGLEIAGPLGHFREPTAAAQQPALHALALELTERCRSLPGVVVENKGLTLSVHYRHASLGTVAELFPLVETVLDHAPQRFRLTHGLRVFEVRPRVDWHKGAALHWLRTRTPASVVSYLGDDQTDEDAFAAIPEGITVRVGEQPASAARFHVPAPTSVPAVLAEFRARRPP
jgi:trehalose 6-phosphate phosphatase